MTFNRFRGIILLYQIEIHKNYIAPSVKGRKKKKMPKYFLIEEYKRKSVPFYTDKTTREYENMEELLQQLEIIKECNKDYNYLVFRYSVKVYDNNNLLDAFHIDGDLLLNKYNPL